MKSTAYAIASILAVTSLLLTVSGCKPATKQPANVKTTKTSTAASVTTDTTTDTTVSTSVDATTQTTGNVTTKTTGKKSTTTRKQTTTTKKSNMPAWYKPGYLQLVSVLPDGIPSSQKNSITLPKDYCLEDIYNSDFLRAGSIENSTHGEQYYQISTKRVINPGKLLWSAAYSAKLITGDDELLTCAFAPDTGVYFGYLGTDSDHRTLYRYLDKTKKITKLPMEVSMAAGFLILGGRYTFRFYPEKTAIGQVYRCQQVDLMSNPVKYTPIKLPVTDAQLKGQMLVANLEHTDRYIVAGVTGAGTLLIDVINGSARLLPQCTGVDFSTDGQYAFLLQESGDAKVYSCKDSKLVNASTLPVAQRMLPEIPTDGKLSVYDMVTHKSTPVLTGVDASARMGDGYLYAYQAAKQQLVVYDISSGKQTTLKPDPALVAAAAKVDQSKYNLTWYICGDRATHMVYLGYSLSPKAV